jgi:acyl dehydratase
MNRATLTSATNYFEDFQVGMRIRHPRGKTVGEFENVLFTHMTMNTAQGHFNEDAMAASEFGQRIVFGGITASLVIGLASQDTSENALREIAIHKLRLKSPVFHGDTLYVVTEVLATAPDDDRPDCGRVTFRHLGINHRGAEVCEIERSVLLLRRPASS